MSETVETAQITDLRRDRQSAMLASKTPYRYPRFTLAGLIANALMISLGFAFLLPLLWLILTSFDRDASPSLQVPHFTLQQYNGLLHQNYLRPFYNSIYLACVSTIIAVAIGLLAGYALSRRHVPLKRTLLISVLFMSGLPVTMLLVPAYEEYVKLNWTNSLFATSLFLAATSLPFTIWLLKNFVDQVPLEFEEAAAMEGASDLRIMVSLVIPLAMPGILVCGLINFIGAWGAFAAPLVLDSNPSHTPAPIAIYQFLSENGHIAYGSLAAYSILFALPVILLYVSAARRIAGAFSFAGGVKG